jgi:signal transduction histidine kinase
MRLPVTLLSSNTRMRRFFLLCGLLGAALLSAWASAAQRTPSVLRVADGTQWSLNDSTAYWRDPGGRATVEEVSSKPASAFTPLDSQLSLGFTSDAVWLRFTLEWPEPEPAAAWWLELGQTIMEDARLFAPTRDGRYVQALDGPQGDTLARRLEHRRPLFEIHPVQAGPNTFFIRLATSTSMSTTLTLWEPRALIGVSTVKGFTWGWMFGAYALAVVFYFFFWLWTRERIHLLYTSYVAINCLAAVFTGGWPAQLAPDVPMTVWVTFLGVWISLSVLIGVWFTIDFLRLRDMWPRLSRLALVLVSVVCAAGIVGVSSGHYRLVIPPIQLTSVVIIVISFTVALYLVRRGHPQARLFLFAFSFFYIGVIWRYLRNFGVLEPNFWNDNSYQFGAFIHMLVMSIGIFASYNRMRRDKQNAEARATAEVKLRTEQRDFVSMVSHELRTPLSIIGASADNLSTDPSLGEKARQRVHKIINSGVRMTELMDSYLSKERMLLDSQELQVRSVDLVALCRQVQQDVDEAQSLRIDIQASRSHLPTVCDASLIRIAVQNLVNNALRHSPATGRVVIALESRPSSVEIRVCDQGSGIPPDEIDHIFTRFYRGRGALDQPGAGLGLYLVRTIVEQHGGWVRVENQPGGGCEFRLQLPQ